MDDSKFGTAPPGLAPHLRELFEKLADKAPPFSTRRSFTEWLKAEVGIDYSHRTVETWDDLPVQYVAGKATFRTIDALRRVFAELSTRPVVVGGRRESE